MNPYSAACRGFLFSLPFIILNTIIANRIEPFFTFIRPGEHTSVFEYVLLLTVLLFLPIGAFVAIRPMLYKGPGGKRHFYLLNSIIAALLLFAFISLSVAFGSDIYRCDVAQLPNCD